MKISKDTLDILKHYSQMNPGIIFDGGNRIYTKTISKTCRSTVIIPDDIPKSAIGNLPKFLGIVNVINEPDYFWEEDCVRIQSEDKSTTLVYYLSDPSLVANENKKLDKDKVEASTIYKFDVPTKELQSLFKVCSTLDLNDIRIYTKDNGIFITALDKKKGLNTSTKYEVRISDYDGDEEFDVYFKKQNMQLAYNYSYVFRITTLNMLVAEATDSPFEELVFYVVQEAKDE